MKTMLAVLVTAVLLTMTGCGPEYRAPEDSKASGGDDTQSSISATMLMPNTACNWVWA